MPDFNSVVRPGALPTPGQGQTFGNPGAQAAYSMQGLSMMSGITQGLQGMGAELRAMAVDQQQQANRAQFTLKQNAAWSAINDLTYGTPGPDGTMQGGYINVRGEAALTPAEGRSLEERYSSQLKTRLDDIADGLGNDEQKAAFGLWRAQAEADFAGKVKAHQFKEGEALKKSAYQGAVDIGVNNAGVNWQDDARIANAIDGDPVPGSTDNARYGGVRQNAAALATVNGMSGAQKTMAVAKAVSSAHMRVIASALAAQDSGRALEYFTAHKGDMTNPDAAAVTEKISAYVDVAQVQAATQSTVKHFASQLQPTTFDDYKGVRDKLETANGKDYDNDGKPWVSSAGARFRAQVTDKTAQDPGYGIKPAASVTPEEYNRVGDEKLAMLVKRYGNAAQVFAAYNGGEGHVDAAIKDAKAAGHPENWMEELRKYKSPENYKQVTDYVARARKLIDSGGGVPAQPTVTEFVDYALSQAPDASPKAQTLIRQAAEHTHGLITKGIAARQDAAMAEASRALFENGGRYDQLPADLLSRIDPTKRDGLISLAGKIAKGQDFETDLSLYGSLITDPDMVAGVNLDLVRPKLSVQDFKHVAELKRAELARRQTAEGAQKYTSLQTAGELVKGFAAVAGITMKDNPERMARILTNVQTAIFQSEAGGTKLNPEQLQKLVTGEFVKVQTPTWFGFSSKDVPKAAIGPDDKLKVPADDRRLIEAALKRAKKPVTDEAVQTLYRTKMGIQ